MAIKKLWWQLRFLWTLFRAGGWRDLRTCLYLTSNADWEGGLAHPADTAREEMSYMAQDIG